MIRPELFSDSHQAFKQFREVTRTRHFLKSRQLLPPPWPWILLLAAWLAIIWIVHFFFPRSIGVFWLSSVIFGTFLSVPFLWIGLLVDSMRIIRALKEKKIADVKGLNW